MPTIYDLSQNELTKLYAIDPILDKDWQGVLTSILSKLDPEDRQIFYTQNLKPKGITYNAQDGSYTVKPPKTLSQVLQTSNIINKHLAKAAQELLAIYPPPTIRSMPLPWLMK